LAGELVQVCAGSWRSSPYTEASSVYQGARRWSDNGENGNWFSEKIVLKQRDGRMIRQNLTKS
jgi:hypothetical protein